MAHPPLFDRELSWLQFNERVLQEAGDPRVPLNERLNFLAIFSSNLDEFVRVRVAALRALVRLKKKDRKALDFSPGKLLRQLQRTIVQQQERYGDVLRREVLPGIEAHGVALRDERHLTPSEASWVRAYFLRDVAPLLHPHFLDEYGDPEEGTAETAEAPFLENGRLYLVAELWPRDDAPTPLYGDGPTHALVSIPSPPLPRFIEVPADAYGEGEEHGRVVLFLDDVVRLGLTDLFPGYEVGDAYAVKLSRDADLYVDDEFTGDLVEKIRKGLERRQSGQASRFLYDPRAPYGTVSLLKKRLGLEDEDLTPGGRYHNLADLWTFPRPNDDALSYPPFPALPHPTLAAEGSVLAAMKVSDRVVHLPYQSYDPVIRFIDEAAADPDVEDVWATLYRVARDSAIVNALCRAAESGKQVTAFVELKARFDEEHNLAMADRMEAAGVRVRYSIPGLKVHAKMLLAGRREGDARVDYAALSTGNFNEKTARIYADHVLLTADPRLTTDVREVFRFLVGETKEPDTRHLLVAPFTLASGLFKLVDGEVKNQKVGEPAGITLKMNAVEDEEAIEKLYEASQAGIPIHLVVRGLSRLIPGVEGWSKTIDAYSIVDRYLEHARVYRFLDGGAVRLYLASADWMRRNLRRRVEVAFPLYDAGVREEVEALLRLQLADDVKARVIDGAQSNRYVEPAAPRGVRAQWESYRYVRALAEATGTVEAEGDVPTELSADW